MNWEDCLKSIEDYLCSELKLNVWENGLYYFLLRHTRLDGKDEGLFSIQMLAVKLDMSDDRIRKSLRSMDRKGCIRIANRSGKGHLIHVLLPSEIPGLVPTGKALKREVDIDSLDFFTGRKYADAMVAREKGRCFYCLREINAQTCVLDHVKPQVVGIDNSYTNIVACCHECNSGKQGRGGEDFVRGLYRKGLLVTAELDERLANLELLRNGKLIPRF